MAGRITVTQAKSVIGTKPVHRKTMKALGLAGIGRTTTLPDSPDVRGMLARVDHLVTVEAAVPDGGSPPTVSDGGSPPTVSDGGSPPTEESA